jgi:creatinine amidohydrolase
VRTVQLELMRPSEVVEARARNPIAFVPIGPVEWHGPHLPLGTDGLHAHEVSVRVARKVGGVVHPALHVGADLPQGPGTGESVEQLGLPGDERIVGMDYPGNPVQSIYLDEGLIGLLARELVRSLKAQGYELIVLVNGHGATNHQRALRRVAIEESDPGGTAVVYVTAWVPPEPPASDPGHADRYETSIVIAIDAALVDVDALSPRGEPLRYDAFGIVDGAAFDGKPRADFLLPDENDPRHASAEEGTRHLAEEVERVCAIVMSSLGTAAPPTER